MTAAERLKEELTFRYVKGVCEKGLEKEVIATAFQMPLEKV
jgi:hypothetical protein